MRLRSCATLLLSSALATTALAQETARAPYLVRGARTEILILTARTLPQAAADERLGRMLRTCVRALPRIQDDSAFVVGHRGQEGWPSIPPGAVGLVVLPQDGLAARCDDDPTQHRVAPARGLRFTFDTTFSPERDVRRVTIRHGTREILPLGAHQGTVRHVTPWGPVDIGVGMQRIDVALDALAGDSAGLHAELLLEVRGAGDGPPDRVTIPAALLDSVWADHIGERAQAGGVPALLAQRLGGSTKRRSVEELRRDDVAAAVKLAQSGDALAARYLLDRAIERDPCLTLSPETDERARRIATPLARRASRCEAIPLHRVALRGALLPGFGRPVESGNRVLLNSVLLAGIVGTGSFGVLKRLSAQESYDAYLAVEYRIFDPDTAGLRSAAHYEAAEADRVDSRGMIMIATGLWVASVAEAVLRERGFARYLGRITNYEATGPERIGITPLVRPGRVGVTLTLPRVTGGMR